MPIPKKHEASSTIQNAKNKIPEMKVVSTLQTTAAEDDFMSALARQRERQKSQLGPPEKRPTGAIQMSFPPRTKIKKQKEESGMDIGRNDRNKNRRSASKNVFRKMR